MSKTYAGIGSRETPEGVLVYMTKVAAVLAQYDFWLHSGRARGADRAFELGAQAKSTLFVPWLKFGPRDSAGNVQPPPFGAEVVMPRGELLDKALTMASMLHPNWGACYSPKWEPRYAGDVDPVRRLHAHSCFQVLGKDLNSPVDFVLYWAPPTEDGLCEGGTRTAVALAHMNHIPHYNLARENDSQAFEILLSNLDSQNHADQRLRDAGLL